MTVDPVAAIRLSLIVAFAATFLGTLPATTVGWWLARRDFWGKSIVQAAILAPLVFPPVVTGLLLLRLFGRATPLGHALDQIGLPVTFSLTGAVLVAGVVSFPLFVSSARSAFEAVDPRYEDVARSLGDPPWQVWRKVTLPLAFPGLASGAVLAFARALGEFGATVVIAGNMEGKTRTIALATYALLDSPTDNGTLDVLLWTSVGLSVAALAGHEALQRWHRRRLGIEPAPMNPPTKPPSGSSER
jgi:molybdate transport system permease protein